MRRNPIILLALFAVAAGGCDDSSPSEDAGLDGDTSDDCLTEGASGPSAGASCCEALVLTSCATITSSGDCVEVEGRVCCSRCGDGECGPGENSCTCAEDCPAGGDCLQEGGALIFYPGAPACCEGLAPVGCESPDEEGECQPCAGASTCVSCGDGLCGLGENGCNCKDDC